MPSTKVIQIDLENLARGKLPKRIVQSINQLEISIKELDDWEESRPPVYVSLRKGRLVFKLNINISIKKGLAWLGGIAAVIWAVIKFVVEYLPTILDWTQKIKSGN